MESQPSQEEGDDPNPRPRKRQRIDSHSSSSLSPSLSFSASLSAGDAPIRNAGSLELEPTQEIPPPLPMPFIPAQPFSPPITQLVSTEEYELPPELWDVILCLPHVAFAFQSVCKVAEIKRRTDPTLKQKINIPSQLAFDNYIQNPTDFLFVHVELCFRATPLYLERLALKTLHLTTLALGELVNNDIEGMWVFFASNLQIINLSKSPFIKSLSTLAYLPKLHSLDLSRITAPQESPHPRRAPLIHSAPKLIDAGSIITLTNLQHLNLASSGFRDHHLLTHLTKLQYLDMSGYLLDYSFSFLSTLTNLQILHAERTFFNMSHFSFLSPLTSLRELWMSGEHYSPLRLPAQLSLNEHPHLPNLRVYFI